MSELIKIGNQEMSIKEWAGKRVVTFADIDKVHERPSGTAGRNFRRNKDHFIEGVDFYKVNQPDEIRRLGITRPQGGTPIRNRICYRIWLFNAGEIFHR